MSTFGRFFRVTTFGESHGKGVGCIIDGIPPLIQISTEEIQFQLDRRKPNQNSLLSARNEPDTVEIYSGVQEGITLGTPLCLIVKNTDIKPEDYKSFSNIPRPGHADFTYLTKYGVKSSSGGGRASARETVARVAAGAVAEKFLKVKFDTEIVAFVSSIGHIEIPQEIITALRQTPLSKTEIDNIGTFKTYSHSQNSSELVLVNCYSKNIFYLSETDIVELQENTIEFLLSSESDELVYNDNLYKFTENINIRCPHPETAVKMIQLIRQVKADQDSVGGIVSCVIKNCPQSLGEPCFDKFEADLAKAMLSIPATKGFDIGSGFEGTKMR